MQKFAQRQTPPAGLVPSSPLRRPATQPAPSAPTHSVQTEPVLGAPTSRYDLSRVPIFAGSSEERDASSAIRGSRSRVANEHEAERAAHHADQWGANSESSGHRPLQSLPPRSRSSRGIYGPGRPLPGSLQSRFETAFGYQLGGLRLHDDPSTRWTARGMGAAAFASGSNIGLANSHYGEGTSQGRHVLAHEVAHVIQSSLEPAAPAVHCFESPEHKRLGDESLDDLLAFLQTPEGAKWAADRHMDAAKLVKKIKADPLKKAGGKITAGNLPADGKKGGKQKVGLTPGEIIALSGDFYDGPDAMAAAASTAPAKAGEKNEMGQLLDAIGDESKGKLSNADKTYEQITKGRYLNLAKRNDVHFAPKNRAEWRRLHEQAIAEAAAAKDDDGLQHALLMDAAGGHFLTDAYASGHMFKKNELMAEIHRYLAEHPIRTSNPELQTYAGIVDVSGNSDQLLLKNIHDRMNHEGFEMTNPAGMKWRTFGDGQLSKAPDTERIASLAVFTSRQQIYEANKGGKPDPKEVEAFLPDDTTLDKATAQAVAYIPQAASEVEGLMYRGRDLASTQFPGPLGPIIKSNLSTIANPGRERQLMDLKQSSEAIGGGPQLAPQFTIFEWGKNH